MSNTQRKPTSKHLSFDPEQFRLTAEFSPVHMIFTDADGIIVYANPAAQRITGYARDEMIGKPLHWWGGKMTKEFYDRLWKTVKTQKKPFHGELQQKRMNGDAYTAEIWITPVIIKRKLSGFVGVEMDVSDRKKLLEDLTDSEQQFRQMTDNIKEMFFLTDLKTGRIIYQSPSFETIWGISVEKVYKDSSLWLKSVYPEDRPMLMRSVKDGSAGKESVNEFRVKRPDGTTRWVRGRVYPVLDEHSKPYRLAGFVEDITEEKQNQEKVRLSEGKSKELDLLKNKFIQIVSHQFRTPLNAMRWNLEAFSNDQIGSLTEAQKQFAKLILSMDVEVINRTSDLLTALDIVEGRLTLDREEMSLDDIVKGVGGEMNTLCAKKGVTCQLSARTKTSPIHGDPDKIRLVVRKLFENAYDYTKKDGTISVKTSMHGKFVRFEIKDTGIGIPKGEQHQIFARFFRASNASSMKPDASGLGLYIAKNFIEQHGGTIGFTSAERKGSTFWFELPITR